MSEKVSLAKIKSLLRRQANPEKAKALQRYFKTGPGEYGEGDQFLGLKVPEVREVAKVARHLQLSDLEKLLHSPIHEERLCALEALVMVFEKGNDDAKDQVYRLYMKNRRFINNWDLIDGSAPVIVGGYSKLTFEILKALARSPTLWDRRIAIMATFWRIRAGKMGWTLQLSRILLKDSEDLIHKAVGWMLREVGNRDLPSELKFLDAHAHRMPRTMLRYAIEKFPEGRRKHYLNASKL